jgi:hypothetical protein
MLEEAVSATEAGTASEWPKSLPILNDHLKARRLLAAAS